MSRLGQSRRVEIDPDPLIALLQTNPLGQSTDLSAPKSDDGDRLFREACLAQAVEIVLQIFRILVIQPLSIEF